MMKVGRSKRDGITFLGQGGRIYKIWQCPTFITFSESKLLNCCPVWGGEEGGVPGGGSAERSEHEGGREVL